MSYNQVSSKPEQPAIVIKGIKEGLHVKLSAHSWIIAKNLLMETVDGKPDFFRGAKLTLEVGEIAISAIELGKLRDRLSRLDVSLQSIVSTSEKTNEIAKSLGLEPRKRSDSETKRNTFENKEGEKAVFINRTLRAGYRVETTNNVIILGDVNPGAEIITGGTLIVWGKLLGSVIAGQGDPSSSSVCALLLDPTQLRIGNLFLESHSKKGKPQPEMVTIENGEILTKIWKTKGN